MNRLSLGLTHSAPPYHSHLLYIFVALLLASLTGGSGLYLILPTWLLLSLWFAIPLALSHANPLLGLMTCLASAILIPHGMVGQLEWQGEISNIPLHPADLAYIGAMLGWLARDGIRWLIRDVAQSDRHVHTRIILVAFIAGLVSWCIIGLLRDESAWNIVRDARNISFYGLGWLAAHQLQSPERQRAVLSLVLGASLIFSLHCIATALSPLDAPLKSVTLDYWDGLARIYYHNHHLLLLTIPLILLRMLWATELKLKLALGAALLIEWTALTLSLTRSMLLVTVLSSIAVGIFAGLSRSRASGRHTMPRYLAIASFSVVAGLSSGTWVANDLTPSIRPISVFDRATALGPKDSSVRGRLAAYEMALEDFSEHPIVGHGLGAQMRIPWAHTQRHNVREAKRHPAVDSTLLTLMFKFGSTGLILVTLLGLWFIRVVVRRRAKLDTDEARAQWACLVIGTVAALTVSLVQANLIASRFALIFVVWCMLLRTHGPSEPELT